MATIFDQVVLAKTEVTKGTDAVPVVGLNAMRVKSVKITTSIKEVVRTGVKQTMGNLPHLMADGTMTAELVFEMRGSGTAGTAPEWAPVVLACRTAETVVAATSVTYKPSTLLANEKSATVYIYQDGLLWKFIGAVGDLKIDATMEGIVQGTATLHAAYAAPTLVTCPTGAVYNSTQPLVMSSISVVNDGTAIKVGKVSLAAGNAVHNHQATGLNEFSVAERNPTLSLTKDSVSTVAEWTALNAGTAVVLSATFGATAGNIVTLSAPNGKRKTVAVGMRGERFTHDIVYGLYESTSDDQFSIALT